MKKFWSYISNGEFSVGCTGQTVYLYDKNNNEIGKFKDIIYAYSPAISPDGKIFVVKSTDGRLAVYSLETFSLIKKFRFSKVDGCQDDGFCFSPDGELFINIERHKDDLHSAVSFYKTLDFSLVNQIDLGEDMVLDCIEFDKNTNTYYVLGFNRDKDFINVYDFVAKLEDYQIKDITPVPDDEFRFYRSYKSLERTGFTEKKYKWSYLSYIDYKLNDLKSMNLTLANLYEKYNK